MNMIFTCLERNLISHVPKEEVWDRLVEANTVSDCYLHWNPEGKLEIVSLSGEVIELDFFYSEEIADGD